MAQLRFSASPAAPAAPPAPAAPWRRGPARGASGLHAAPEQGHRARPEAGEVSDLPWVDVVVPVPAEALAPAPAAAGPGAGAGGSADEAANAPGWFDATWALQQGLEVIEGLPRDLALDLWREAAAA